MVMTHFVAQGHHGHKGIIDVMVTYWHKGASLRGFRWKGLRLKLQVPLEMHRCNRKQIANLMQCG